MRLYLTLAATALLLAGCGDLGRTPAVVDPIPIRGDMADQNRFVPPPGGFGAAAAAAQASSPPFQAPMHGGGPMQGGGAPMAGFEPLDDNFRNQGTAQGTTQGATQGGSTSAAARDATGPNIVEYALSTAHPVGTPRYRRSNPLRWQTWERNCMRYPSQDAAQEAFLAGGGPERDRHNLDPDGDGYACWWDPEPIRRAMRADG